jgi:ABC-type glycerol-3-phosphate transport system substrate-binding protein
MTRLLFSIALLFILSSCSLDDNQKQVLRFAHFWTEPNQQKIIDSLIVIFEKNNPEIQIEQIPLQWSEGRTKLLLAHSSSQEPDITHIGIEWAQEFINAKVFMPLIVDDTGIPKQFHEQIRGRDGKLYCMPWTMNTRALVLTHELSDLNDSLTWQDIITSKLDGAVFGINASEKHNVMKRILPILWSGGSIIFTKLPFSETCDEKLVEGLHVLSDLQKNGILEQSRILDKYLIQGKIRATLTGQWMIPQLESIPHKVLARIPGKSGASILSGDCLGISSDTKHIDEAIRFVQFLTKYEQSRLLCTSIPDAGIPAHNTSFGDSVFTVDIDRKAFLQQCKISMILPSPVYFQDAEELFEEHIMRYVYGKISDRECVESMKKGFLRLEEKNKNGS